MKSRPARVITRAMLTAALLAVPVQGWAQEGAPPPPVTGGGRQFTNLADMPIAGLLERGNYEIDLRMYPEGGVYTFVRLGFLRSVNIGFSYGAENVVGRGKVIWNPNVEFDIKARIIPETSVLPAFAVGYASQGFGPYLEDLERYTIKSPGFYLVASKNYRYIGEMGLHGGVNKSREGGDDNDLNVFLGVDKSLGPDLYLIAEYNAALNDNDQAALGYGNGYLNFGLKWAVSDHLRLELFFTNLITNVREADKPANIKAFAQELGGAGREIRIVYVDWF
jgi:hypothetical protein